MAKMHADEFEIDIALVQQLVTGQFPNWAHLPLQFVPSAGTDNALYRLGTDMVVRLPRIDWAVGDVDKECQWLPKIASFLPVSIPIPLGKGIPTNNYPWPWSVYRWLEGSNPIIGHLSDPAELTRDLVAFIQAMHRIDLKERAYFQSRGTAEEKARNSNASGFTTVRGHGRCFSCHCDMGIGSQNPRVVWKAFMGTWRSFSW